MKFSVVICTYNRRDVLAGTLPSVLGQDFAPDDYEVIVVVDGSEDGTAEMLAQQTPACGFQVLRQPNRGLAAARNAGLQAAKGDFVIFLDDDIVCHQKLLSRHWAAHERKESAAVVFGPVLVAEDSLAGPATWWTSAYTDRYIARLGRTGEAKWPRDMVMEANYSAPLEILLASGGNDLLFGVRRQSADWGLRLHKMGVPFHYVADAVVWQRFVKTSAGVVSDAWWYGKSEVMLSRKHPEYRPHSIMARLWGGGRAMPVARRLAATLPFSVEPLLRPPSWAVSRGPSWVRARQAAVRLLELRQGIPMMRGAVAQAGGWKSLLDEFGRRLPVLLYHHVGPCLLGASPGLTLSPTHFERQVRWLAERGYTGIRPAQWLDWVQKGVPLPQRPVLLTFDDALADLARYAFPILRQHGFSAGVYVVTAHIGRSNTWAERGAGTHSCLSASQIREWAGEGIEFGAHSRTHPDLTRLPPELLEGEVAGCKDELASLLGQAPLAFAYPFGRFNGAVQDSVRRHFRLAFTTEEGLNDLGTDPHLLRRTMALPSDFDLDLHFRTRWGRSPLHALRARLRLRSRVRQLARGFA